MELLKNEICKLLTKRVAVFFLLLIAANICSKFGLCQPTLFPQSIDICAQILIQFLLVQLLLFLRIYYNMAWLKMTQANYHIFRCSSHIYIC
jgi:hypothetical protein